MRAVNSPLQSCLANIPVFCLLQNVSIRNKKKKEFADLPVVNLYSFIPHGIEVR